MAQNRPAIGRESRWHAAFFVAAALLTAFVWLTAPDNVGIASRFVDPQPPKPIPFADPLYAETAIAAYASGVAHSPTVLAHADGTVQAMWFAGSHEAGHDVGLDEARYENGRWTDSRRVLDAYSEQKGGGFFAMTIGNPVLFVHPSGGTWLAYVTPAIGGWSTSRISLRRSDDGGRNWGEAHVLDLAPFIGISNLVRFPALAMSDGHVGLPTYHELARSFSEIAVIDAGGRVVDKRRIGAMGDNGIQTDLLAGPGGAVEAYLRPAGQMARRLYKASSDDGGLSWTAPEKTDLVNSQAPACSETFADGSSVMVFNDTEMGRGRLAFVFRRHFGDGWQRLDHTIVGADEKDAVSYCSMSVDAMQTLHMVYSRRSDRSIRHVAFNRAWIESRLAVRQ